MNTLTSKQQQIKNRTLASILATLKATDPLGNEAQLEAAVKQALYTAWNTGRTFGRNETYDANHE